MKLNNRKINELQLFFSERSYINKAFLYGSRVSGKARSNSDIDIMIDIDYEEIKPKIIDLLMMSDLLSKSLGAKVSITTREAFSNLMQEFTVNTSLLIYDKDEQILIPAFIFNDFEYKEYRDKVKLEHISISLKLIVEWMKKYDLTTIDDEGVLLSAIKNEFKTFVKLFSKLSSATKEETLRYINTNAEDLDAEHISSLNFSQDLFGSYYGVDKTILYEFAQYYLPTIQKSIDILLSDWEGYFKNRVKDYFTYFFAKSINNNRKGIDFMEKVTEYSSIFNNTLKNKSINELTDIHIKEGEDNILKITNQINIKNIWNDLKQIICPFFPFC
ncbi:hypothetical protein GR160_01675 [Flavobacterium sp. Sd200]|uniref:nucleotidyltransferase domain-containing protein n=1 Tax=Flavobacterium sp. Sd200 TaxID=2692211 RepID=UPI00136F4C5A|nr:nucleotidyltransferase domain-containing protein [Flavobacterium sp. Sd200]MXN89923.1 hypothetical protein [Flavobacterium sp. Sd200]